MDADYEERMKRIKELRHRELARLVREREASARDQRGPNHAQRRAWNAQRPRAEKMLGRLRRI